MNQSLGGVRAFGADIDGRPLLATAGWDHTIRFWDPTTGEPIGEPLIGHTAGVSSVAFGTAANGRPLLATAGHDRAVRMWDPATRTLVGTLRRRTPARAVIFVGRTIAIGDAEGISLVEPAP